MKVGVFLTGLTTACLSVSNSGMNTRTAFWLFGGAFALLFAVGIFSIAITRARAATFSPITNSLDVGSRGADVTTLQSLLATSPALYPAALVTGYYGPLTRNAVIQFQLLHNIAPVGRVGPITRTALNALIATGAAAIDVDSPTVSTVAVSRSATSATVSWTTNEATTGRVHWSSAPLAMLEPARSKTEPQINGAVVSDISAGTNHSLTVGGLSSGQTYYYNVTSFDTSQNVSVTVPASFTTP